MGVGSRTFRTFLCDACGREIIADEEASVDGYYIEVLRVQQGKQDSSENVYACSAMCVQGAISGSLKREALPEAERITATQELWLKGRQFSTDPRIPILDMSDETHVIGTAMEIAAAGPQPLDIDWKPDR